MARSSASNKMRALSNVELNSAEEAALTVLHQVKHVDETFVRNVHELSHSALHGIITLQQQLASSKLA